MLDDLLPLPLNKVVYEHKYYCSEKGRDSHEEKERERTPHEVSAFERNRYYAGIRAPKHGPKLIYRTSDDVFVKPEGPDAYRRVTRLLTVSYNHEIRQDDRWNRTGNQVRGV